MKETKETSRPKAPPAPVLPKKPREQRRDAKLAPLNRDQRYQVVKWMDDEKIIACRRHIEEEFKITVSRSSIYAAVRIWRRHFHFEEILRKAQELTDAEVRQRGDMTIEEIEEATDRNFIILASDKKDPKLYRELRYMRMAAQTTESQVRVAEAKIKQGAKKLKQGDKALKLAERRVVVLETKGEETKEEPPRDNLTADERSRRVRAILGL
ncbi:MAG: hypothetical protein P4L99_20820 [Chthoniobacter sp.]|nr:hypothetical protein [Chthoniobacter sp.]